MSVLTAIGPVYALTFLVGSAWVVYGLGYARGYMQAHRRGVQRQKAALAAQQRASDRAMDGLAALQRQYVQQIQRDHLAELQRVADAAVIDALSSRAPHPLKDVA